MKRSYKSILSALILALLMAMSVVLAACGGGNNNPVEEEPENPGGTVETVYGDATLTVDSDSLFTDGVHVQNITSAEGYVVQDGKTSYAVVYPAGATARENTAVSELRTYFEAATGITLSAVSDANVTWSSSATYISVGATTLLEEAGVELDASVLGQTGLRVVTKGKTIFLAGAGDYGTLYAVYQFLGYAFDWETYSDDVVTYNTGVTELPLQNYDVTEVPDFEYNIAGSPYVSNDEDLLNRFRMINFKDQTFGITGNIYHNSLEWLPTATYQSAHPDWYSTYGNNLCYYARGNQSEYEAMVAEVVSLMIQYIPANAGKRYIAFGIQDTQTLCACSTCTQKAEQYNGSQAASVILFLNDVYAGLQEWFEGEGAAYYCGQKILFFAYHATNTPPVEYNEETGEYEALPIDEDDLSKGYFSCENIVPWFAETNGDYLYSLLDERTGSANNASIAENLKGWGALADEILFWTYGTNFSYYLTPYYSFEAFQETYQFAASEGVKTLYAQHQTNNANSTGWERLKGYLNYKLGWNVNYNVNELIERFFENYFGPASDEMLGMFTEYRVVGHLQRESGYSVNRSIFANPLQAKYWPRNSLADWMSDLDRALEAIAYLEEEDADLYDTYYKNIVTERVWVYYLMVNIYSSTLSDETLAAYRSLVKQDCTTAGIDRLSENVNISTLWSQWGLS